MRLKKATRALLLCSAALTLHTPANAKPSKPERSFFNVKIETTDRAARKRLQKQVHVRHASHVKRHGQPRRAQVATNSGSDFDRHSAAGDSSHQTVGSIRQSVSGKEYRLVATFDRYSVADKRHYSASALSPSMQEGMNAMNTPVQGDIERTGKRKRGSVTAPTGSGLVEEARRWLGTNPTGRASLWCATFMNFVLERTGRRGTGSNMASSFASYGQRIFGPQVGAIAVMTRGKTGGHVGVVSGVDENGNPIVISGNHNRTVAEATYPRSRIYAYVVPK